MALGQMQRHIPQEACKATYGKYLVQQRLIRLREVKVVVGRRRHTVVARAQGKSLCACRGVSSRTWEGIVQWNISRRLVLLWRTARQSWGGKTRVTEVAMAR